MSGEIGLDIFHSKEVDQGWKWNGRGGIKYRPHDMETRHLFYTIRMIWNHSTPEYMHVGKNIHYYSFPPEYTREYMGEAVYRLGSILVTRKDITADWRRQMEQIAGWLREYDFSVVHPLKGPKPALTHSQEITF